MNEVSDRRYGAQARGPVQPQTAPPPVPEDDEIDLLGLVRTLWRGKWVIGACAALTLLIGGYYVYELAVPKYAATTTLALEVDRAQVVDLQEVVSGVSSDSQAMQTELELLKSRVLLGQVVDRLDLTTDPEFNARLRPEPRFSAEDLKNLARQVLGRPVPEPGPDTPEAARNRAIGALGGTISPSILRGTYVFTIRVVTENPGKSARIANTLAGIYLDDQIRSKLEATEGAVTWLSERLVELEAELQEREDAIEALRAEADFVSPEGLAALNAQAREARGRLDLARADEAAAAVRVAELEAARGTGDLEALLAAGSDPTLERLAERGPAAEVLAAGGPFLARYDQIAERAGSDLARSRASLGALEDTAARLDGEIAEQSGQIGQLQQMMRERDAVSTLYETFLTRLRETTVQQGIQQADARVLSEATGGGLVEPRTSRVLALSLILGLMLGGGIVLLREALRSGFRTSDELAAATGIEVIGQIPVIPIRRRRQLVPYLNDKPNAAATEAIRNLRTSILMSNIDAPPQVIAFTSSVPGEGKTTDAIAVAHNLGGLEGKRVLLLEGDVRRRTFSQYFPETGRPGLLSLLSGEAALEAAVVPASEAGIRADVIMGEKSAVNAADAFASQRFRDLLETLRGHYDYIVIDTPPVLVVPDARVIGQSCDAIVYCVHWDRTPRPQVQDGLRELRSVNLHVAGTALTKIDPRGMKRYGYGGKYGAYARYGNKYYQQ